MKFSLFDIFDDIPTIDIVDVGASPIDGQPPYQPLFNCEKAKIVGFEPNPAQFELLLNQQSNQCTFLPYAIGDGQVHTLNICHAPGMSSLLEPDMEILKHFHGFEEWSQVVERKTLSTVRLDDVKEIESIDYIKLDVQGSELAILQNGSKQLSKTLVIHIEVQFIPFYINQPLFGELDQELRNLGFYLHRFSPLVSRVFKPLMANNSIYSGLSQILWSDAIYVRKFTEFPQLNSQDLLKIAAIAHDLYDSFDLCSLALGHIDSKEQTNRQPSYLKKLIDSQ